MKINNAFIRQEKRIIVSLTERIAEIKRRSPYIFGTGKRKDNANDPQRSIERTYQGSQD